MDIQPGNPLVIDLLTCITSGIKELPQYGKAFFMFLEEHSDIVAQMMKQTIDVVAGYNKETNSKQCVLSEGRSACNLILAAVQDAYEYINSVYNLLFYARETDYESTKDDIRNGSTKKLNQFLQKMKVWLELTKQSFIDYCDKCDRGTKRFADLADTYKFYKCEEKATKKQTRIVGGIASTVFYLIAGAAFPWLTVPGVLLIFGVSGTVGISCTILTWWNAGDHGKNEAKFEEIEKFFRQFSKLGEELRHECDDFQESLKNYENNWTFADRIDKDDQDTLCSALDNMKRILETNRFEISKAKCRLQTLNEKLKKANQQWLN